MINSTNEVKNLVFKAAEQYGFSSEFNVKKILDDLEYVTETNVTIFSSDGRETELDVIASDNFNKKHILIECKGCEKDSILILIESPDNIKEVCKKSSSYKFGGFRVPLYSNRDSNELIYTFTGDFFKKNGKALKRCSQNDSRSNFFKAQKQISEAIQIYSAIPLKESPGTTPLIAPLIVTNSEIWVIQYENKDTETATNHKWVFQHMLADKKILNSSDFQNEQSNYLSIPIVNINYFKEFMEELSDALDKSSDGRVTLKSGGVNFSESE